MDNSLGQPADGIELLLKGDEKDLGGFSVRRLLPHRLCRKVGPFVFFDHFGPARFKPGDGIDVRPHPHIGLATITYLFEGEIYHRDSLGYVQPIRPGAVNWMIAGRGIAHSERTGEETRAAGHDLHGLQVWVGLPEEHEEVEPQFLHVQADALPRLDINSVSVRVVMGSAFGERSPVKTYSPLFYLDVILPDNARFKVPEDYTERGVHVVKGSVSVNGYGLEAEEMAVLATSGSVEISTEGSSRVIVFGGEPITKRHVWWNFVSSSRDRIEQAKADWKAGRFAKIPGEIEFIPLPDD